MCLIGSVQALARAIDAVSDAVLIELTDLIGEGEIDDLRKTMAQMYETGIYRNRAFHGWREYYDWYVDFKIKRQACFFCKQRQPFELTIFYLPAHWKFPVGEPVIACPRCKYLVKHLWRKAADN